MPSLAAFHPQVVHFVVALLLVGVAFRVVSLTPWFKFTNYGVTTLLLIGAAASWLAVRSGTDAHGPVERIPGVRALVIEHEELAELTRNIFLGVAAIEIIALALSRRDTYRRFSRYAHYASALVGIWGCAVLYETAEHGGELVYSYGGGPGLRTGDPADVERTYVAAAFNQAQLARRSGRAAEAAALIGDIARRLPNEPDVKFLQAESLLRDTRDYAAAMRAVDSIAATDARSASRKAQLKADIYIATGRIDSARAVLRQALGSNPGNTRLRARLDSLPAP